MKAKDFYNVAVYLRLSKDDGEAGKAESNSITSQRDIIRSFIRKQDNMEIFDFYVDDGWSGANFDRPSFKRMMADIEAGHIDCVIVKDLSRFGRNHLEMGNYLGKIFPFLGVRFIAVNDNFDNMDGDPETLGVQLKNLVNELYAKDIAVKIRSSRVKQFERGSFSGCHPVYGYDVVKEGNRRVLVINEEAAVIVRELFGRFLRGEGYVEMIEWLYTEKIHRPSDYRKYGHVHQRDGEKLHNWHKATLNQILNNCAYIRWLICEQKDGERVSGRTSTKVLTGELKIRENNHEPIISEEVFQEVARQFEARSQKFSSGSSRNLPMEEDIYKDLVYCGLCGSKFTRECGLTNRSGGKVRNYQYRCVNKETIDDRRCDNDRISLIILNRLVEKALEKEFSLASTKQKDLVAASKRQALLDAVKNAEINCIIVKDFSRFARDYIEPGSYLEQIFPFMGVRFISINDKYDSDQYSGNVADIDVNFKNLRYDLYSKDLSIKIKASVRAVKEQGKAVCSTPPFGYTKDPEDRHKFVISEDEAVVVRRLFRMYADGMSTVEIARIFNEERVKPPSQVWMEKGIRVAAPKGGAFVWQHSGMLRMLKNRAYVGDLVQGVYECRKIRDDRRVTDPEKWIVTENHHEPIIDREIFDKVQARFQKSGRKWKRKDHHVLVGRVKCGCCGHNLRHSVSGHHYYWCPGLNIYHMHGCVKRIDDFYLEENILFQIQQHIMDLGESDKLLQIEKETAAAEAETLRKKCQAAEKAIEKTKAQRMAEFEAYVLGQKKSYDASINEVETLRETHEELMEQLSEAEDKVRQLNRVKVHESFAATRLTEEILDEYVESIEVHSGNEVRISWK